jgi:hypothetical protein
MRSEIKWWGSAVTLRRRDEASLINRRDEERVSASARRFLADRFRWSNDRELMAQLCELLGLSQRESFSAVWRIERAVESGELVIVPDVLGNGFIGERLSANLPRPRSLTFTPSELFRKGKRLPTGSASISHALRPRYRGNDFFAIMAANPGDVLPDGSIATAINEADPFEFATEAPSVGELQLAARGIRITGNEPGGFQMNPNGLDVDYFDSNGNLCAQYHGSHGDPHGHNFINGVRDKAHLPMSSINCE